MTDASVALQPAGLPAPADGLALVIGGAGFLGGALVRRLRDDGIPVRSFDLTAFAEPGVESVIGDLRRPETIVPALRDVTVIFQTASYVGWNARDADEIHAVNVAGNRNLLRAAQAERIPRFVYTSSIDVVFDGTPIHDGDKTIPYPARFLNAYSEAKAVAEQETLAANDRQGMLTCALRAAGIFGPGDRHRLPNVLRNARAGRALRLGDGQAVFNHVYVENVVHAHILAARALTTDSPVPGEAYFIVDDPPSNFFDFMEPFLEALGYPLPRRSIPRRVAYALAVVAEGLQRVPLWGGAVTSPLTRYTVASTCVDFSFTGRKAAADFEYQPLIPRAEALWHTIAWLRSAGYANSDI